MAGLTTAELAADLVDDQLALFEWPRRSMAALAAPGPLSVTGLVSYARCPRQFYWLAVRPLPRVGSAAATIGTEIHRWIERRGLFQLSLMELEGPARSAEEQGSVDGLRSAFLASPYARLTPMRVEAPFALAVGGRLVRGRIDAVYGRDGRLELVDFKTGSPPALGDRGAYVQLDLYAVAAVDVWREDPAALRTTYCYLGRDGTYSLMSSDWDPERWAAVRAELAASLDRLAAEEYTARPGAWCARCEWQHVCRAGRAWLEASEVRPESA